LKKKKRQKRKREGKKREGKRKRENRKRARKNAPDWEKKKKGGKIFFCKSFFVHFDSSFLCKSIFSLQTLNPKP
jgi:hypothetical protein